MALQITSLQNAKVKEVALLKEKSRERKKKKRFILEGERELSLALAGNYELDSIFYNPDIFKDSNFINSLNCDVYEVTKEIYNKIAYRETTEGILGVLKTKEHELERFKFENNSPLIVVAEAPEKPGNIGALLRTCDAANVDLVIIANPRTDLYNPNIIRSSVGTVFTTNVATGNTNEVLNFLTKNNVSIYCAELNASENYHLKDYKSASAIVVGTEATGLSQEWLSHPKTQNIIIPMQGKIDSMNVSVAASIIIFEAKRQRNFK